MVKQSHLQRHATVHACWIIAVLVAVIAWLLLDQRDGSVIRDYIAFAASLTSLILAVVAIFYAIVANHSQAESLGTLRSSIEDISVAAENIAAISLGLSNQSERMIGEVEKFSPAVSSLIQKMNEGTPLDEKNSQNSAEVESNDLIEYFSNIVHGGQVSLYLISKAIDENKSFNIYKVFGENDVYANFVSGFIQAVRYWKPCGITFEYIAADNTFLFKVVNFDKFPYKSIIEELDSESSAEFDDVRKYFSSDRDDNDSS